MKRPIVMLVVGAVGATCLVGVGSAREVATFQCPKDATKKGTQFWVKNYQKFRGSTWCNDGATVVAKIGNATPTFPKGICTKDKNGKYLQFGTRVSPLEKRRPTDPPGLFVNDPTPASGLDDYAQIGKGKLKWQEKVKITWTGPLSGSFSGTEGQWIDNEYTLVKAAGKFTCKRVVATGW